VFIEQGSAASRCSSPSAWSAAHVRRPEHLHPAEGQPGRRHPIIFASAVLYLPVLLSQVLPAGRLGQVGVRSWIDDVFRQRSTSPALPDELRLLIIGFAYFYTAIAFDPVQQADNLRKQGGFIPGIRPGPQTERYLAKILSRITLPGALFIAILAHRAGHPRRQDPPGRLGGSGSIASFGGTRSSSPWAWPSRR
jgi:hypothetical protein